ncbi:MAG: glycosyltransferase family 2 protein [Marinifilaceae bacterium]|jgi:GT2 family glycosyltransferase|nr:glycosyltransferase family 2 protein [Marinifilaceae bacterium]
MKKLAVVILNWNGLDLLKELIPHLEKYSKREWSDLYVADNCSSDESVKYLRENHPDIKIIELDENYGFSGGYNKSLSMLEHDFFVLLNSDVEVTENWLDPIYHMMCNDDKIGIVQPKIKDYYDRNKFEYAGACGGFVDFLGYPFCRGRIFDSLEEDSLQYNSIKQVFWASGAAMFVRAELYKNLGGLDEMFFAHMEEIDFCWRSQRAGYKVMANPNSTVYHMGGATLSKYNSRKLFLNFRNNLLMLAKNLSFAKFLSVIFLRLILDGVAGVKFLFEGKVDMFFAVIKAHFAFYGLLFSNISEIKKSDEIIERYKISDQKQNKLYKHSIVKEYYINSKKYFSDLY